ncbi:MAG: serine hydrolase [Candidatus Peribacteraceae bacterium]|jgi:D-alanyl-D-alanine carboxypeptidase (penicillin-binding protein 5/6)
MFRSVLAALLLGMLPLASQAPQGSSAAPGIIAVAPPMAPVNITEHLSASGVLIIDANGGQELYAQQATVRRPMASLTKLMTALIIVENHEFTEVVAVPQEVENINGSVISLPPGERFTVSDLLSALLIASSNDASYALAVFHSGSEKAFVEEMNKRAQMLGLNDTHYANASGLDSTEQWSTPRDIAWLASFVLKKPAIRERMGKRGKRILSLEGTDIFLTHTHALLHTDASVHAGKTGTTNAAKECLLSLVDVGGKSYIVVLLHSVSRYMDMRTILDVLEGSTVS